MKILHGLDVGFVVTFAIFYSSLSTVDVDGLAKNGM